MNKNLLKGIKENHSFQKYVFQSVSIYFSVSKNASKVLMWSSIHFPSLYWNWILSN
jgi:hypothetical protein